MWPKSNAHNGENKREREWVDKWTPHYQSQMMWYCDKIKNIAFKEQPSMSMMLLTYFGVICDLLLSRSRVTWTCCFKWYRKQNVVWWHQLCICPPIMSKNHESVCILQLIIWRHSAYLSLQFFFGEFFVVLCFLTLRFSSLCTVNLFYFIVIY